MRGSFWGTGSLTLCPLLAKSGHKVNGIVTLTGVPADIRFDFFSGCSARILPHIERVGPKSLERGSAE